MVLITVALQYSLKSGSMAFNFLSLSQSCFGYSGSSHFYENFRTILFYLYGKFCWYSDSDCSVDVYYFTVYNRKEWKHPN